MFFAVPDTDAVSLCTVRPQQQREGKAAAVFDRLRGDIVHGRLVSGDRLPGSRSLAARLGVARGTVNVAYAMLAAEGLVEIPQRGRPVVCADITPTRRHSPARIALARWASRLPPLRASEKPAYFASGKLAQEHFPERDWLAALGVARRAFATQAGDAVAGHAQLRRAIADHLRSSRGFTADAEQVVVTNGSMQAITLLSQLLLNPGDVAAVENPGFHGIHAAVAATGARVHFCSVDDEGMQLPRRKCRAIFTTPASQFPTGIRMSHGRRGALLASAASHNTVIVEDEYDSEFTRLRNPPPALKLSDGNDRVIYIGSFSRTMFNSLRIGYCVLPDALVDAFLRARRLYDTAAPQQFEQTAMAHFMQSGAYRRHLRRMNAVYNERHDALLAAMNEKLADYFAPIASAAGLSVCARWRQSAMAFARGFEQAKASGCAWQDASAYFAGEVAAMGIFGFASLTPQQLTVGVDRLARVLRQSCPT